MTWYCRTCGFLGDEEQDCDCHAEERRLRELLTEAVALVEQQDRWLAGEKGISGRYYEPSEEVAALREAADELLGEP